LIFKARAIWPFYLVKKLFIFGLIYYEDTALQDCNDITVIDLGIARKETLNEFYWRKHQKAKIKITVKQTNIRKFGTAVKKIMDAVFRGKEIPVKIIGTPAEVDSFIEALKRENQYIKTARKYGLDDHRTYKLKYKLQSAVSRFERDTDLKWPLES
jgi:hypothetical protein